MLLPWIQEDVPLQSAIVRNIINYMSTGRKVQGYDMREKGVNINLWSMVIFVIIVVIMVFFGVKVRESNLLVQEQAHIEENRRECELQSQILSDGSDYLTNEVYHFIVTGEIRRLENYWNEVTEVRSRDQAIETLASLSLTEEEQSLMENAKLASDELIQGETWAMKLTADSIGMDLAEMPVQVAVLRYENGEAALSAEEKRKLAAEYIFGAEYSAVKEKIRTDISSFRHILSERKNTELEEAVARTGKALEEVRYLMLALVLGFALESVLFYCFIIRPFSYYVRTLRQMDAGGFMTLIPMGARETRAFANVFNKIYFEWQRQKEKLEKDWYRFHVALENTSVVVYEYDVSADICEAFGSLEDNVEPGAVPQQEYVISGFMSEHAQAFMGQPGIRYFEHIIENGRRLSAEMQITLGAESDRKIWVNITGTPVLDDQHKVCRIIGKLSNIQSEKEKEFALEDARSRDGLTNLYKQGAGIDRVREAMSSKQPDEICALMILDMDDFGLINQSEGQTFADAVLQDVADILRTEAGPEDIPVRLGGDEFMLFLRNCPKARGAALGNNMAGRIRRLSGVSCSELKISASIGIAFTAEVDDYADLYRYAESTLKYVKEHGKGRSALYSDVSDELGKMLTQMYPQRHNINKIDRSEGAREELTSFALELLGKSRNLDDAIFLLLSRVGRSCGMDRIVIIDLDTEYLTCRVRYQWTRSPSDRMPEKVYYITREELTGIYGAYDSEGLSDRRIISSRTRMQSILHSAIWNYDQCVGAMSFEFVDLHPWTDRERQLLSELTRIISSFILKARSDAISQAKTDFLSRMSHEIRTPMNAITGMTIIAKTVRGNPDKTMDCLNKIEKANKYLLSLINDVLDMSRIESGKIEIHLAPVKMSKLTENLDSLVRPQADEKKICLEVDNQFNQDCPVWADELRLNQILVNLLGNAMKFTGEGGHVTLGIVPEEASGDKAVLRFSVSDNGIGISREAQERIFNAFEQASSDTASNYGGTGLGLTISSCLIQMMGGKLEVDSRPGEGATFSFVLHLSYAFDERRTEAEPDTEQAVSFKPKGKRLLLAEDNEINREIAQEILEMYGFEVETAANGKKALEQFEQHDLGFFDAILMDIRMPIMDGIEATKRIRTLGRPDSRSIPIIAMTADAFDEDTKKSLKNGMNGHLSKPIDVDLLLKTLGRLISVRADYDSISSHEQ